MFTPIDVVFALPWLAIALLLPLLLRDRPQLEDQEGVESDDGPLVSIIVPARNEAANIGACLASLLDSDYTKREIIVVDDHSTDGTGDIARTLADRAGDGTLRLIEGRPLPDGWVGKCWACWQGYEAARGDVLLFTDADTRHDDDLLQRAIGALQTTGVALVSVLPRQIMRGFWERAVLPHIFLMISARFRDLDRVNRTRNPRDVIANGQFMMFTRAGYEEQDGHRSVRGEVVEDLRLAQHIVAGGGRIFIAHAQRLMETRMYRSLGGIVEGWSKNLALGSRNTVDAWLRPALPWLIGLSVLALWVMPPVVLLLSLIGPLDPGLRGWAILATSASLLFWLFGYVRLHLPVLHALLFPLGGLVAGMLFLRSAVRGGSVGWKGRTYRVDAAGQVDGASQVDGAGGVRSAEPAQDPAADQLNP